MKAIGGLEVPNPSESFAAKLLRHKVPSESADSVEDLMEVWYPVWRRQTRWYRRALPLLRVSGQLFYAAVVLLFVPLPGHWVAAVVALVLSMAAFAVHLAAHQLCARFVEGWRAYEVYPPGQHPAGVRFWRFVLMVLLLPLYLDPLVPLPELDAPRAHQWTQQGGPSSDWAEQEVRQSLGAGIRLLVYHIGPMRVLLVDSGISLAPVVSWTDEAAAKHWPKLPAENSPAEGRR